jgi:hypothetical protein
VVTRHNFNLESYGGAHRVALEVVFEMKAQAEAKLHMYHLFVWLPSRLPLEGVNRIRTYGP